MKTETEIQNEISLLKRGVVDLISEPDLKRKLSKKASLVVKAGFDPTAPDLHLGHFVLLRKLKTFQDLGHTIYFLLGDFSGMIGDPTGKSETRKRLSKEQVLENAKTYETQVFKILDATKTKVVFNSQWCSQLKIEEVLDLFSKYTVSQLLERDDFSKRHKTGNPISLIEFMYPLIQGYDSVELQSDIEIGGTDQKFNLLVGRHLQKEYGKEPQCVMTLPLLVGLDGVKKMSKSLGNYVGIQESPLDMYGKLMSMSDTLMWNYFELLTEESFGSIEEKKKAIEKGELHPKEVKSALAIAIMNQLHSETSNSEAKAEWNRIHEPKNRAIPEEILEETLDAQWFASGSLSLLSVLAKLGFLPSTSEGRRLVASGGLYLNEEKLTDLNFQIQPGNSYLVRQGKKGKFLRILT